MANRIHPIYVGGPLEGEDFPASPGNPWVQAMDYGMPTISRLLPGAPTGEVVTYRLQEFGWHGGGTGVHFWAAAPEVMQPDAVSLFRVLCKPELFARMETFDVPPGAAARLPGLPGPAGRALHWPASSDFKFCASK